MRPRRGAFRERLATVREQFWFYPAVGIALAVGGGLALPAVDKSVTVNWIAVSADAHTARAVLSAIATLSVSVAGVSFSVIAVALVLASQQLSPRVLRSFQREPLNQVVLGVLLATAAYALFVLGSVGDDPDRPVPELSVTVALAMAAVSLGLFVLFLHHVVRSLNASAVIRRIAAEGHRSIEHPYPQDVGHEPRDVMAAEREARERTRTSREVAVLAPRAGYIAEVDGGRIVAWAAATDAFVEQVRGVGEFAITGAVLARVHIARGADHADAQSMATAFRLEEERLVDRDIAFPIRQLADVALKGLSPAMNDPTTAANAMDSITDTLARFAQRPRLGALRVDDEGVARLRAIAPTLDDLIRLGFDQVRHDAAGRPAFAVRLLELLADLRETADPAHACREIDRQAQLIADQAVSLAGQEADRRSVADAHARLHGSPHATTPS